MTSSAHADEIYYPWFDVLRLLLAVIVMFDHKGVYGDVAVRIFFVLSGWLIGGILLKTTRADLPRFFFNRAARIWIPYYIALALLLLVSLQRDEISAKWLEIVGYTFTMTYNAFGVPQLEQYQDLMPERGTGSHFWSVNAEEQFYLLAPLIVVGLWRNWGRHELTWAAITAAMFAMGSQYTGLSLGVLAAVCFQGQPPRLDRNSRVGLLALMVICLPFLQVGSGGNYMRAAPLFSLALVLLLATPGPPFKLGAVMGGVSYPLYLNHWVGGYAAKSLLGGALGRHSLLVTAIGGALSVAFAVGHYHLIDRQVRTYRHAVFTPGRAQLAMSSAYVLMLTGLCLGFVMVYANKALAISSLLP